MTEPFLATPEGAVAALRAGRRRRLVKQGGLGSSMLALALGALTLLGGGTPASRPDQLTSTTSPSAVPSPRVHGRDVTPPAGATALGSPRPAASAIVQGGPPSPGAAVPPTPQHRVVHKRVSPISSGPAASLATTDLCQGTDPTDPWCLRAELPGEIKRGTSARIGVELCLSTTARAQTITLTDTREASIEVSAYDGVIWQGGEGISYRKPGRTLSFQPGQCVHWWSSWDTRDREGFVVPPGSYDVTLGIDSAGVAASLGTSVTVVD